MSVARVTETFVPPVTFSVADVVDLAFAAFLIGVVVAGVGLAIALALQSD